MVGLVGVCEYTPFQRVYNTHGDGGDAGPDAGGASRDSDGGGDVGKLRDSVFVGDEVMSSEETTIAGELGP